MAEAIGELSESDLALIDALGVLFDLIVAGNRDTAALLASRLDARAFHWTQKEKARTAAILSLLKVRTTDPAALDQQRDMVLGGAPPNRRGH